MMSHLFYFEWLQLRKTWSFRLTALIVPVIIGYSLLLGHQRVQDQHAQIQELLESEQTFYDDLAERRRAIELGESEVEHWFQNPGNPLVLAQFGGSGRYVFLSPKPLAALAAGQSDLFPYYGKIALTNRSAMRDNALENPVMQVAGPFDFAFVLVWLIPLFVITIGYDVLSREKEGGTLALLQSQPVSIQKILLMKVLFRFLVISGIVLLSVLVFGFLLGIPIGSQAVIPVLLAIIAYIAFWFALCVLVNWFSDSSAINAITLVGLWVLFVLIIPSLISLFASNQHPVPSRAMWVTDQRGIQQAVNEERHTFFESWKADHPEEVMDGDTPDFYLIWMQRLLTNEVIQDRVDEATERFNSPREQQVGVISKLRPLSPSMLMHHWMQQVAGTDAQRLQSLDGEMREFQKDWKGYFIPRFRQLKYFSAEEISQIPRLDFD
ncbi:MAG: ABC transporter permease subunit [Balneolales bacterium]|nr:ABC transporter permease subunit [Balneolales bacterium]